MPGVTRRSDSVCPVCGNYYKYRRSMYRHLRRSAQCRDAAAALACLHPGLVADDS